MQPGNSLEKKGSGVKSAAVVSVGGENVLVDVFSAEPCVGGLPCEAHNQTVCGGGTQRVTSAGWDRLVCLGSEMTGGREEAPLGEMFHMAQAGEPVESNNSKSSAYDLPGHVVSTLHGYGTWDSTSREGGLCDHVYGTWDFTSPEGSLCDHSYGTWDSTSPEGGLCDHGYGTWNSASPEGGLRDYGYGKTVQRPLDCNGNARSTEVTTESTVGALVAASSAVVLGTALLVSVQPAPAAEQSAVPPCLDPAGQGSMQLTAPACVNLVEPAHLNPVGPACVDPAEPARVNLVEPAHLNPVGPACVDPSGPACVNPVETTHLNPVGPCFVDPVAAAHVDPPRPARVNPIEPAHLIPVGPACVDPAGPARVDPVEPSLGPFRVDSVGPARVSPVRPARVDPAGLAYMDPVGPAHVDPVGPASVQLPTLACVNPVPATCVDSVVLARVDATGAASGVAACVNDVTAASVESAAAACVDPVGLACVDSVVADYVDTVGAAPVDPDVAAACVDPVVRGFVAGAVPTCEEVVMARCVTAASRATVAEAREEVVGQAGREEEEAETVHQDGGDQELKRVSNCACVPVTLNGFELFWGSQGFSSLVNIWTSFDPDTYIASRRREQEFSSTF